MIAPAGHRRLGHQEVTVNNARSRRLLAMYQVCMLGLLLLSSAAAFGADRPNIVLMLSDNIGYGELGAYGGGAVRGAPTPRLDTLAGQGIRFTNFNVEVECTPSGSALMTGRYPIRAGTGRVSMAGLPGGLAPWEYTMAEMLSNLGYRTAIFGKWHIGAPPGRFPTDQGFDEWWGFPFSTNVATFPEAVGFDVSVAQIPHLLEGKRGERVTPVEPYTTENRPKIDQWIAERSVAYIEAHAQDEAPFFLYIPWSHAHHPYLAHPDFKGSSTSGDFGDVMVEHDARVGQVLDAIDAAGIADDTLVIYASDNGPDAAYYPQVSNSGPFRGYLGSSYEGGIRTPMMIRWPGRVPSGWVTNAMVSITDFMPTLAAIVGGELPADRAIDGVDQSALFLGASEESAREAILIFLEYRLLAIKWRQFKVFLTGDSPDPRGRPLQTLFAPHVFNVEQDPREEVDVFTRQYLWVLQPTMAHLTRFLMSVKRFGLIPPGGEERAPGAVRVPFVSDVDAVQAIEDYMKRVAPK
jgi:arylsulfatase